MYTAFCDRCSSMKPYAYPVRLAFDDDLTYMVLCPECLENYKDNIRHHMITAEYIQQSRQYEQIKHRYPLELYVEAVHWVYDHHEELTDVDSNHERKNLPKVQAEFKEEFPDFYQYNKILRYCIYTIQDWQIDNE